MHYYAIVIVQKNSLNKFEFHINFTDFVGCTAKGETLEVATTNAIKTLNAHIKNLQHNGANSPTPSTLDQIISSKAYSQSNPYCLIGYTP
ncbi:MAG: type II toxin-antitoxin system HicB family antitoxin [Alphaproteobacteria bacterium]|nr:type II toxin-antitoxin system HicB family antitoxin [Alphaproteobacteria bacterium]